MLHTNLRLVLLLAFVGLLTACAERASVGMQPPAESQPVLGLEFPLIQGRTVEVDRWHAGGFVTERGGFMADQSLPFFLGLLGACFDAEIQARIPDLSAFASEPVRQACDDIYNTSYVGLPLLASFDIKPTFYAPMIANCMAHWALYNAESTEPLNIGYYAGESIILPHGDELPEPFRTLATTTLDAEDPRAEFAASLASYDPSQLQYLYRVRPPSTSDRATWALLATELYRTSALLAVAMLDEPDCRDGLHVPFESLGVEPMHVIDLLTGNLTDAVDSAVEASDKARELIAAAATEKRAGAADPLQAIVDGWRGRHNSRLEAVSAVVGVPEKLYEQVQPVPLFHPPSPEGTKWVLTTRDRRTNLPTNPHYLMWALPADTPEEGDLIALRAWRAGDQVFTSTDAYVPGATFLGIEGYVFTSDQGNPSAFGYLPASVNYVPEGLEVDNIDIYALLSDDPIDVASLDPEDSAFHLARRWPVVTALTRSPGDQLAEELIRSTGVKLCRDELSDLCGIYPRHFDPEEEPLRLEDLPNDLFAALVRSQPGAYEFQLNYLTPDQFLAAQHITRDDLTKAATRVVQTALTLGHWPGGSNAQTFSPIHPAVLYAKTAGVPNHQLYGTAGAEPEELARSSVAALLEYVDQHATALLAGPNTNEWHTQLNQLLGYVRAYTEQATIGVEVDVYDGKIEEVRISRGGLDSTPEDLAAACEVWVGEAGLQCALSEEQDCARMRVGTPENPPQWELTPQGVPQVTFTREQAPTYAEYVEQGIWADRPAILNGERIYVVCDLHGKREPIAAVTVARGTESGVTYKSVHPPYSTAVLAALSDTLATDPEHAEQSALSCAGVPYDIKIPLENELTEAIDGSDGIESSFAHYLKLARQAADRADELGSELVEQGIQMDLRAEKAREELEDLCGGVVNVPSFSQAACDSSSSCDIPALLTGSTGTGDLLADSELSGAAQCLGAGTAGNPTWAGLGNQQLCIWQHFNSAGKPVLSMVCPEAGLDCSDLSREVQLAPASPGKCSDVFDPSGQLHLTDIEDLAEGTSPNPDTTYARRITELLQMTVTDAAPSPESAEDKNTFACRQSLLHRRASKGYERPAWMTQEALAQVAEVLGYEEDVFGIPSLTLNGRPWISFGNEHTGPVDVDELRDGWPYARHPMLVDDPEDPTDAYDAKAAGTCQDEFKSLFCGGYSKNSLDSLGPRLAAAVISLKGLTGAGFDNVSFVEHTRFRNKEIPASPDRRFAGDIPTWFEQISGAPAGSDYYRSNDGAYILFDDEADYRRWRRKPYQPVRFNLNGIVENETEDYDYPTFDGIEGDGWPVADVLWRPRAPERKDGEGWYLSAGSMRRFVTNEYAHIAVASKIKLDLPCRGVPNFSVCWIDNGSDYHMGHCQAGEGTSLVGNQIMDHLVARSDHGFTTAQIIQFFGGGDDEHEVVRRLVPYACDPERGMVVLPDVVHDAMDIACAAIHSSQASCSTLLAEAPTVGGVEDFPRLGQRVLCAAQAVQRTLDRLYVAEMPADIIKDLAQAGAVQTFTEHRGMYGTTVAELVEWLTTVRGQGDMVVQAIRDVATILSKAAVAAEELELNTKIQDVQQYIGDLDLQLAANELKKLNLQSRQAISDSVTSCLVGIHKSTSDWTEMITGRNAGAMAAATANCVNSGLQVAAENQLIKLHAENFEIKEDIFEAIRQTIELRKQATQLELNGLMYQTVLEFSAQFDKINEAMLGVQKAQAGVQGALAKLEMQRNQARRAAAKALLLGSDETGRVYNVNLSMRARMNTLRVRYEKARQHAIAMAYMARRAVEQKLGVDLSFLASDMTLVEAPAKWADKLCSLSGIDYDKIRTGGGQSSMAMGDTSRLAPEDYDYADGYVGDWVTLLENFVESYSVDMPFQAGTDLAVVSLRDELMCVRAQGEPEPGWNLLYHTDGRDICSAYDENSTCTRGWQFTCDGSVGTEGRLDAEMSVFRHEDSLAYPVFGDSRVLTLSTAAVSNCQAASGPPRMRQEVDVSKDTYWLSWVQPFPIDGVPIVSVLVEMPDGTEVWINDPAGHPGSVEADWLFPTNQGPESALTDPWLASGFVRYYAPLEVTTSGKLAVGFFVNQSGGTYPSVAVAGVQLELTSISESDLPRGFFSTSATRSAPLGVREDSDGTVFRTRWQRGCEYYCPPGSDKDCARGGDLTGVPQRCFWESNFAISLEEIEKGNLIPQAGFARGNFNYRFDSIALNVVGAQVRDCSFSEQPASCTGGNFLQYSLQQSGPFRVRNHAGNSVRTSLHTGEIQQAKALLAERYLANPPSASDQDLIGEYWRSEYRGRPLDGAFKLRIYDADGLDWTRVEDVQLAIRYRYWTRLD